MERIERDSFVFYKSFYDALKISQDANVKWKIFEAVCEYVLNGVEIELDDLSKIVFNLIISRLESDELELQEKKKRRSEAGKKGMENRWGKQDNNVINVITSDNKGITNDNKNNNVINVISCYKNEKGVLIEKETDKEKEKENTLINTLEEKEKEINKEKDLIPQKVYILALSLIDGTEYGVTQEEIDSYQQLYPAVNVEQEYRNMAGWLLSNPKYRKTRRGISRFINGWLVKRQDKSYGNGNYYKKNYNYQPKKEVRPDKVCEENEILTEEEILAMIGE